MREDLITYEILPDGTCSYCGSEAEWIELPDGDVTRSDVCNHCEAYNDDIRLERLLDYEDP